MKKFKRVWSDEYTISWFDTDTHKRASLMAICNYLQESAWHHANHLGFGYMKSGKIDHVWVIVRLLIKMERYPTWEDKITINTWPTGMQGLVAKREFELLDGEGNHMGAASSQWFIIDKETRKPLPNVIDRDIVPLITSTPVMEEQPSKIRIKEPLELLETNKARFSSIDMYGHVNNTRYVEWIINSIPEEIHRSTIIHSFLIEFLSETRLHDEVKLYGKFDSSEALFHGIRTEDEKPIFRGKIKFKKK